MTMKIFDYLDWDIEVFEDAGSSGDFVYGSYIEWDRFRDSNRNQLLEAAGAYLPIGEKISINDFLKFISQDIFYDNENLRDRVLEEIMLINGCKKRSIAKLKINFIDEDSKLVDELINAFLDDYGVPSGTQYEEDLDDELKYWSYQIDNSSEMYRKYPIKLEDYEKNIKNIYDLVDNTSNELVKKSLILSSLIITETIHKSVIIEKLIENEDEFFASLISNNNTIDKILNSNLPCRSKYFKKYLHEDSPDQMWIQLRNSLAHSIDDVYISDNGINYMRLKSDKIETIVISDLKRKLLEFGKEIKAIIDKNNKSKSVK